MRFNLVLDAWDVAAFGGLGLVLGGLFAWHPPAGYVAVGLVVLAVYAYRELYVAPKPPSESERQNLPGGDA